MQALNAGFQIAFAAGAVSALVAAVVGGTCCDPTRCSLPEPEDAGAAAADTERPAADPVEVQADADLSSSAQIAVTRHSRDRK